MLFMRCHPFSKPSRTIRNALCKGSSKLLFIHHYMQGTCTSIANRERNQPFLSVAFGGGFTWRYFWFGYTVLYFRLLSGCDFELNCTAVQSMCLRFLLDYILKSPQFIYTGPRITKKPPWCSGNVTRLVNQESQVRSRASPVRRMGL